MDSTQVWFTIANGTWHVENPDGDNIRWQRNNFNFYEGTYCVKLDNYNNVADNTDPNYW